MKIALIHNQYKLAGGMERYLFDLLRGFVAAGDQVDVFVQKYDRSAPEFDEVAVHSMPARWLPRRWRKYRFLRHCNHFFQRDQYDISLSMTRTFAADIAVCGGVHATFLQQMGRRRGLGACHDRIELGFEKRTFLQVPSIMAHSKMLQAEIEHVYPEAKQKTRCLYPPLDVERFTPQLRTQRDQFRAHWQLSDRKTTLLFPSTGHKRKGLFELLAALAKLPQAQFELLVAGHPIGQKTPENVRFLGYVDAIEQLYAAVDYVVLPSHYEPFGLVVTEALQCGTPVIVSNKVGAAELMQPHDGIVLTHCEPSTIADALMRAQTTPHQVTPQFAAQHQLQLHDHINAIRAWR